MKTKNNLPFPADFLWGASSSAYQSEGGVRADHKGLSVQDVTPAFPGTAGFKTAVGHYFHFKEDIALLAEMGLKAYRFSISWPRLLPAGSGKVNALGVKHYHEVIDECLKYGIQPIVTLYHFDLPLSLQLKGGWTNRKTVDAFVEYATLCFKEYGSKVKYFLTINEQNMMIMYNLGAYGSASKRWQANHNMLVAAAKAMIACHQICSAKIGPAPNVPNIYPATDSIEDQKAAKDFAEIRNHLFIQPLVDGTYPETAARYLNENGCWPHWYEGDQQALSQAHPDFIAFNYYGGETMRYVSVTEGKHLQAEGKKYWRAIGHINEFKKAYTIGKMTFPGICSPADNDKQIKTPYGMAIDPDGLEIELNELWQRYHLPLLITENGCGAKDVLEADDTIHDTYRIDYLRQHIQACQKAIANGVNLFGYSPWSAFDLISTHQGITKRYGFIYVDRDEKHLRSLKRYRKDSFFWYQKVIKNNGTDLS